MDLGPGESLDPQFATGHHTLCGLLGLVLQRRFWIDLQFSSLLGQHRHRPLRLLTHVREFVRDYVLALLALGIVLASTEGHVIPDGERPCVDRLARRGGSRPGVNTDVAQRVAHPLFHRALDRRIQRLTGRRNDGADRFGNPDLARRSRCCP